jgi:hypothetical protein
MLMCDQWDAIWNLKAFYLDDGILSRRALFANLSSGSIHWSLYLGSSSSALTLFLLGVSVIAALALLFGYRTRPATIVSWVLVCSLQGRNGLILHGGDVVTRLSLFWCMFLPLGKRWSIDARQAPDDVRKLPSDELWRTVPIVPSMCYLLQLAFIYWFSAAFKYDPVWHAQGSAIYLALSLDVFATPLGKWLLLHEQLCRVLTHAVYWAEAVGPILLLLPFWKARLRIVGVILFIGMHLGIESMMRLGSFSCGMCVMLLAALPPVFWNWIEGRWMLDTTLRSWLSNPRLNAAFERLDSIFPRARANKDFVAFGMRLSQWAAVVCVASVGYVLLYNLRTTNYDYWKNWLPNSSNWYGNTLRLEQNWKIFSPRPPISDGWPILAAKLANGEEVDLLRDGKPLDWEKPTHVYALFENSRWRKLLMNLWWTRRFYFARPYVASYLCREWNDHHASKYRVRSYQFWFMREDTPALRTAPHPVKRVLLSKNDRFGVSTMRTSSTSSARPSTPIPAPAIPSPQQARPSPADAVPPPLRIPADPVNKEPVKQPSEPAPLK